MTEEEFAKLFPNVKWPLTYEGKDRTHIRTDFSNLPPGFFDIPLTNNPTLPYSVGSLSNYQRTPRQRLVDFLSRTFYDDDRASRERVEFLLRPIDVSPAAIPFASYDTSRAISEGRYKDAVVPGITVAAPFVRKSVGMLTGAKRIGRADDAIGTAELPQREAPMNELFNPKPKPQRPLIEDYPNGVEVDEDGMITKDIEGRPLRTPYIAGRTRADEPDHALSPLEIQRVGEYGIEGPVDKIPSARLGPGQLGRTDLMLGLPVRVSVLDSLPKSQMDIATAHEVAHVVDALANQIQTKGLKRELDFNYSALRTGQERNYNLTRPQDVGYQGQHLIDRERMAEAIRAYMVDPNYFKTVAPKTAARIRKYVFESPELSKIIQFNSLAAGGALALALGTTGQNDNANANEVSRQTSSAQKFNTLVQAILARQAQSKPVYGAR